MGALSLLCVRSLAFDPEAWVVWGREIGSFSLDTSAGPSWKPLPVFLTGPFGLFGDAAPWLWLAFARAAALMAVAGVAELVRREAGWGGAATAAALVLLSPWWLFNGALGNSEPLLVALIAWAAVAHRAERVPVALALGFAAALLRPEVWPFLLVYVVWLERRGSVSRVAIGAGAVALLALWTLPDLAGSDWDPARAFGERGSDSSGDAAMADVPFLAVLEDFLSSATAPVVLAAAIAAFALPAARLWAGAGVAWALLVAVMAQAGLPNHPRYVIPALAALAAAAAVAPRVFAEASWIGHRTGTQGRTVAAVAAIVLVGATAALTLGDLDTQRADLARRHDVARALEDAVERAGGAERLRACGVVRSASPDERSVVARVAGEPVAGSPRPGDVAVTLNPDGTWSIRGCP